MRLTILRVPAFLLFTLLPFSGVLASECEQPAQPSALSEADKLCLAALDEQFAAYSAAGSLPEIRFRNDRNRLLVKHAPPNQQFIIDSFYYRYCQLLDNSQWQLSAGDRQQKLEFASMELRTRVPFGSLEVDTRNVAFNPPSRPTYRAARVDLEGFGMLMHGLQENPARGSASTAADNGAAARDYLRETPYVVTRANKYFVMVASVGSLEDARSEAQRLKRKAPQFDFVVYSPYDGNPNYAIMMATWVPRDVAEAALADAKEFVNRGSIIWSCRFEGDRC